MKNMTELNRHITNLNATWELLFPQFSTPRTSQWVIWVTEFGLNAVQMTLPKLEMRYSRTPWDFPCQDNLCRFATAMMRQRAARAVA